MFVAPGANEVAVLKQFEQDYDGRVRGTSGSSPANEAQAVAGVQWLGAQVDARRVDSALFLANHPARQGIDSPHEIRAWRDADPRVAVGFEGAPGHQAAGLPNGAASGRGFYDNAGTNPARFVPYPPESYRTWGGFDWMTSTVGGLWDSLLAEGKPWWISANSDSHFNYLATATRGPGSNFARDGRYQDPVYSGAPNETAGDYWPGQYSRTNVGCRPRRLPRGHGRAARRPGVGRPRPAGQGVDMVVRRAGGNGPAFPLGSQVQVARGHRPRAVHHHHAAGPAQLGVVPARAQPGRPDPGLDRPGRAGRPRHVPGPRHQGRPRLGHLGHHGHHRARAAAGGA